MSRQINEERVLWARREHFNFLEGTGTVPELAGETPALHSAGVLKAEMSRLDTTGAGDTVWANRMRRLRLRQWMGSLLLLCAGCVGTERAAVKSSLLLNPNAAEMNRRAPEIFKVRLETSKGDIVIEIHRDWAPHGADRFYNLVRAGYYDEARFFRAIEGRWAQFGINGEPKIANIWRTRFIPDDRAGESNVRGTVAFAFAVPNGRTTQVFINLRDNSATHDREPFVPFGKVIAGIEIADLLDAEYAESAGGGIRGGKQDPIFEGGNRYFEEHFPHLDFIKRAIVIK